MRELKQGGLLSVVLPSYNEEASIPRAAERITQLLTAADIPFELLFVDDGSKDGSWAAIQTQAAREQYNGSYRFGELMDTLAESCTEAEYQRLEEIFINCSRYELGFWEMAWTLER